MCLLWPVFVVCVVVLLGFVFALHFCVCVFASLGFALRLLGVLFACVFDCFVFACSVCCVCVFVLARSVSMRFPTFSHGVEPVCF